MIPRVSRVQLLAIAALMAAMPALAQVRQIQTNNPMDKNPGINTGGANQPIPGYVPISGNEVITGNVSGLSYFHTRPTFVPGVGTISNGLGTFSPYQFNGNLGSASLSNFARQSAGGPAYGGINGAINQPYYLPSATVSTAQGSLYAAPVGSGFDSALVPRASISPLATGSGPMAGLQGQGLSRFAPSTSPLDASVPGQLMSSPLLLLRAEGQATTKPASPNGLPAPATMPQSPDVTTQPSAGMVVGAVGAGRDERITGLTPDLKEAQVSDTYMKLAAELRTAQGSDTTGQESPATAPAGFGLAAQKPDIDPFTGKPRQIAMLQKPATTRPGLGEPGRPAEPTMPGAAPSAKRLMELSTNQLTAGSRVKPVRIAPEAAGGSNFSGFEMTMVRAQQDLKAGKYLDAAETFQAALSMKSDDPLALVGRAHAEFGAGLYSSAAYDLKFVYTRKPELMSVRYDVGSFIQIARQEYLLEDLQKLTAKKDAADMASFLYCYLCYQTNRTSALQGELKKWGDRAGHDEWQGVAERAWNMPASTQSGK